MSTRDQLLALNDELRRLKAGGQRAVSVSAEGLAQLSEAVAAAQADGTAETASITTAPFLMAESPKPIARPVAAPAASVSTMPATPEIKLPEGQISAGRDDVADLEKKWLKKLSPFGDRGYH